MIFGVVNTGFAGREVSFVYLNVFKFLTLFNRKIILILSHSHSFNIKKSVALFTILVTFSLNVIAQKVIHIDQKSSEINLATSSEVFRDSKGTMPFEVIQQEKFVPNNSGSFQYSFSPDTFWFRFVIKNTSDQVLENFYFHWSDGLSDYVDLYVPVNDTHKVLKGGLLAPSEEKAYQGLFPVFPAGPIPPGEYRTYYIRLKSSESINGQMTLMSSQQYINWLQVTLAMVWLVIGIQVLRVLYNIILAYYIRNTSFRWYTFHTVIVTISVMGSFGVVGSIFSSNPPLAGFLNATFYELMPATYTLFIFSLLNVRKNFPKIRWVFFLIVACSGMQILAYAFVPKIYLLIFNNYLFLFTEFFLSFMCIYALYKRITMNTYLLIPCFITLVPFMFLNLRALGYINYSWIYPMIYITNFLEILALSLVLGKIIETSENERVHTEKALYEEKIEAEKLQELDAAKTQFFTNISHEFRTPLTLLLGPLQDLSKRYPNENLFGTLKRNALRLQQLINQLLDLAKLQEGKMENHIQRGNISEFLTRIFSTFESMAQNKHIIYKYSLGQTEQVAYFDPDKLEKILSNLLSNAFKFTTEYGKVAVYTQLDPQWLNIRISDNGIGIDSEKLPFIFDRFFQVESNQQRRYEGTGIGLALVKELVRDIKGHIDVRSEKDKGTSFEIKVPVSQSTWSDYTVSDYGTNQILAYADSFKDEKNNEVEDHFEDGKPLLLIVEDNYDLRQYIRSIFSEHYNIIEAENGKIGLELSLVELPDIIISDLMMPVMDGIQLLEALRTDQRTDHIPIILLTAKATIQDKLQGLECGADAYLTKPFERKELEIRVRKLVEQREIIRNKLNENSIRKPSEIKEVPVLDIRFIERIEDIIEDNLLDPNFTLDILCEELHMSRATLHRKLKAISGNSSTQFIRQYRLRKAAELLRNKTASVSEVAYMVGFDNLSYFSKTFQDYMGKSPSDFAKS